MKKVLAVLTALVLTLGLTACGSSDSSAKSSKSDDKTLTIWTSLDGTKDMAKAFEKENPGVKVDVKVFPGDSYATKLQTGLQNKENAPDVFAIERNQLGNFIDSPYTTNLSKEGIDKNLENYVPYVAELGKDADGNVRAVSDHSSPVGFWYDREKAKEYLGTDDPTEISKIFSSWDSIIEAGKQVSTKSGGDVKLISNASDIVLLDQYNMENWDKNGKYYQDPAWDDLLNTARKTREAGVDAKLSYFSPGWGDALNDGSVLAVVMPSWGTFMIDNKDGKAEGKYGVAMGPTGGYSGGTWYATYSGSEKKDLAYDFLDFITSEKWQQQNLEKTGNMPGLQTVYKDNMDTYTSEFTGDQKIMSDYYNMVMDVKPKKSDKITDEVDIDVQAKVNEMLDNKKSNDYFYDQIKTKIKSLDPSLLDD
ncbi:ABC transporter substrate-binding protein [Listeria costaricensis]|uniref:ABC transporter substrate-binding protein n=1 Tax=Listeria costaricensis TaxID=2026604 RepID=UPI0013C4C1C2|nr:ABC transporter substrate-binding protein [Listeria costaricensis]